MGTRHLLVAMTCFVALVFAPRARASDEPATKPAAAPTPFKVDHDAPLEAKEALAGDGGNHRKYRVEFNGIAGDRVPAFLYVPKNLEPRKPAVLLQYGSGGNKSTHYIVALGEQFVGRGFVVLTIDVPNRGERRVRDRETPAGRASYLAAVFKPGTFIRTLGDYSRAVDYLASRRDVDPGRIGYAGISLGAITGLTFAAHEPRVRAVASIVGGANFLGMIGDYDWDPDVLNSARRVDPFYHVAQIAPRPLLLLNARRDQLVPRFFGEQLHAAAGEHAKKVWVDTDHFFRGVDRMEVMESVITFMRESLDVMESQPAPKRQ